MDENMYYNLIDVTQNVLVNCGQVNGRNKKVPNTYYIKFNDDCQYAALELRKYCC